MGQINKNKKTKKHTHIKSFSLESFSIKVVNKLLNSILEKDFKFTFLITKITSCQEIYSVTFLVLYQYHPYVDAT